MLTTRHHLLAWPGLDSLQDICTAGDCTNNTYICPERSLYVAEISHCYVEGPEGLMFDVYGNIYHDEEHFFHRLEAFPFPLEEAMEIKSFPTLVSIIQKYSNMYYHFTVEMLPRIISVKSYLDADPSAKLLVWDSAATRKYLAMIGISEDRIEPFDPQVRCCQSLSLSLSLFIHRTHPHPLLPSLASQILRRHPDLPRALSPRHPLQGKPADDPPRHERDRPRRRRARCDHLPDAQGRNEPTRRE